MEIKSSNRRSSVFFKIFIFYVISILSVLGGELQKANTTYEIFSSEKYDSKLNQQLPIVKLNLLLKSNIPIFILGQFSEGECYPYKPILFLKSSSGKWTEFVSPLIPITPTWKPIIANSDGFSLKLSFTFSGFEDQILLAATKNRTECKFALKAFKVDANNKFKFVGYLESGPFFLQLKEGKIAAIEWEPMLPSNEGLFHMGSNIPSLFYESGLKR